MAFNVRQMPADRAAALIGEDDVAVFSQRLETMAATSQFDLEEPDSTRLTFLFEVGKDDLLREGKWLDGVDYMSDLVFETPRDLAGKIFKRFETFADDDHTPSEALADVRWGFASRRSATRPRPPRSRWASRRSARPSASTSAPPRPTTRPARPHAWRSCAARGSSARTPPRTMRRPPCPTASRSVSRATSPRPRDARRPHPRTMGTHRARSAKPACKPGRF